MSPMLTVGQLADVPALRLAVAAGAHGLDRQISAVYSSDLADPTPWMAEGSLLLTAGAHLVHDEGAGPRLLRRLEERSMSAVGLAITPYLDSVPDAMIEEADRLGLPLLAVPASVPFREVIRFVNGALSSAETARLHRGAAAREVLLEAVAGPRSVERLVEVLADYLGADVLIFGPHGTVLARCRVTTEPGQPAVAVVWESVQAADRSGERTVRPPGANRQIDVYPVEGGSVLAVVRRRSTVLLDVDVSVIDFTLRLLVVARRLADDAETDRRTPETVLPAVLRGTAESADLDLVRFALDRAGSPRRTRWRVATIRTGGPRETEAGHVAGSTGLSASRDGLPTLRSAVPMVATEIDGDLVAVFACDDATMPEARRDLLRFAARVTSDDVRIGISAPVKAKSQPLAQAYVEAHYLAERVAAATVTPAADGLDAVERVLISLPTDALADIWRPVVGELRAADAGAGDLERTARRLLANDGAMQTTADELVVHRNALRKRIVRIAKLTGHDLVTVPGLTTMRFALIAADLTAARARATGER